MNAPLPPLPASLSPTDTGEGDLDTRILRVEQRLIAREENLRRGVKSFGARMGEALQPRRLVKPALIAVGGLAALLLLPRLLPARHRHHLPRRSPPGPDVGEAATAVAKPAAMFALLASLPWGRLLGAVWPMLPQKLRERVSPQTVGSAISVVLPLMESVNSWRRSTRR